ncbi:MAG TPA: hypothetical protein VF976_00970 [Gemmatimonadales bacterium]
MPTRIVLPDCLFNAYAVLFPTLDFNRVSVFDGIPFPYNFGQNGITLTSGVSDINIYLRSGLFNPCSLSSFALLGHELVHALQAEQGFLGGQLNAWVFGYTWCVIASFSTGRGNAFEDEAKDFGAGLIACGLVPCACDSGGISPVPNFEAEFVRRCGNLVKTQANVLLSDCYKESSWLWGIIATGVAVIVGVVYDIIEVVRSILCYLFGVGCNDGGPEPPRGSIKSNKDKEGDVRFPHGAVPPPD